MPDHFSVGITGDFGDCDSVVHDFTSTPSPPSSLNNQEERTLRVPSGAHFVHLALTELLPNSDFAPALYLPHGARAALQRPPHSAATVPPSLPPLRLRLKAYKTSGDKKTHRICSISHLSPIGPRIESSKFNSLEHLPAKPPDLLVIHDGGGRWRECSFRGTRSSPGSTATLIRSILDGASGDQPRIIVNLDNSLPNLDGSRPSPASTAPSGLAFTDEIWRLLHEHPNRQNVCILCSSRSLRHDDALISRHLSWELSVEQALQELEQYPKLRALSDFGHLIIRFGVVATLHIHTPKEKTRQRSAQFVFAPLARDGVYRDALEEGDVSGYKVLLAAAIARHLHRPSETPFEAIGRAMQTAVLACMHSYDTGYDLENRKLGGDDVLKAHMRRISPIIDRTYTNLTREPIEGDPVIRRDQVLGRVTVPPQLLTPPKSFLLKHHPPRRGNDKWEILRSALRSGANNASGDSHEEAAESLARRLNIGLAVAIYGLDEVLNLDLRSPLPETVSDCLTMPETLVHGSDVSDCITLAPETPPHLPSFPLSRMPTEVPLIAGGIFAPVYKLGNLTLIERSEIESVRAARNLVREFVKAHGAEPRLARPISLCVFGPPGSGKSFTIREIIESVNRSLPHGPRKLKLIEFNVSQFRSTDALEQAARRIANTVADGFIPLAFFDEFDCVFEGHPLGWLKYFLAPMQEGVFYGTGEPVQFGSTIFVFAGGIYSQFADFASLAGSHRKEPASAELTAAAAAAAFQSRKGPDFISRLHGHVDILSINRLPGRYKYVIRRALLLRSILARVGLLVDRGNYHEACIDHDVAYALLTIDQYKHGARSMEAVIRMCSPIDGRLEKASLPPHEQLDMHVDANEFHIRMIRGRARRYRPPALSGSKPAKTAFNKQKGTLPEDDVPDGNRGTPGSPKKQRKKKQEGGEDAVSRE